MKILNLVQGSPEWLAHRRTTRNASDASVMMGASPSIARRELVRLCATGLDREFSDYVQKYILDKGHEVEPALRAYAEKVIGEELYPVVAVSDDDYIGASYDGLTIGDDWIFEAKQHSAAKADLLAQSLIPPADYWQIVQQFAVNESAQKCLYAVGDGSEKGTSHLIIHRAEVADDIPQLLAAWHQFDADVIAYDPSTSPGPTPIPPGRAPETLPALSIQVTGMVTASNLAQFKETALQVLGGINRELRTDDDFANAEQTVKWCQGVEDRLEATKQQVLGQTADIDAVFRTMDEVAAETRRVRLELNRLVTAEKEKRRGEIVEAGKQAVVGHYQQINASLGAHALPVPLREIAADLGAAIKGKRSLSSMQDAVDSLAAQHKVTASQTAERVRACVHVLEMEVGSYGTLFPDAVQLCAQKQPEDLRNLIAARIAEHQQKEQARLDAERERIRREETDRLEREQRQRDSERVQADVPAGSTSIPAPPAPAAVQASPETAGHAGPAAAAPARRVKLGDINTAIAPLSINADGLAQLGFLPVGSERSAKLYDAAQVPAMCQAMQRVLAKAAVAEALPWAA